MIEFIRMGGSLVSINEKHKIYGNCDNNGKILVWTSDLNLAKGILIKEFSTFTNREVYLIA